MQINRIQPLNRSYSSPAFGKMIAGEDFAENVIKEAERLLKENLAVDAKKYKRGFMECWEDAKFRPLEWFAYPFAKLYEIAGDYGATDDLRMGIGVATLGLSELIHSPEAGIRKLISNMKANKFAKQVQRCMLAIMRERR